MKEIIPASDSAIVNRLRSLKKTPRRKPRAAALGRAQFLAQAKTMRDALPAPTPGFREFRLFLASKKPSWKPIRALNWVTAVLLALGLFFSSGILTVSASQGSLPGDKLYSVKLWTEDARLKTIASPQARLNLILDLTDRRMEEITHLVEAGRPVPQQVVDRLTNELNQSFEIAAKMEDQQLQNSLAAVYTRTENQLKALNTLAAGQPTQPVLADVQTLLTEGLAGVKLGQADPLAFVAMVQGRTDQGIPPVGVPPKRSPTPTSTNTGTATNTKTHGKTSTATATPTATASPTITITPTETSGPSLNQLPAPTNTKHPRKPTHTPRPKSPGLY